VKTIGSTIQSALHYCDKVATKIEADEPTRHMMQIAARGFPKQAAICYKAIMQSYGRKR